jgi:hypothetical protein
LVIRIGCGSGASERARVGVTAADLLEEAKGLARHADKANNKQKVITSQIIFMFGSHQEK